MLYGFFGRITSSTELRETLDASVQRTRLVADRVSKASLFNGDGFAIPPEEAEPGSELEGPIDLEAEMVSLADEQLYFEATARLLQKAYEQIRTSMRSH
jgi:hypothetical protein